MATKITFLGNRVQDLGGFKGNKMQDLIKDNIRYHLNHTDVPILLTGLSLGIETWAAELAQSLNISYHVYVPFNNFSGKWIESSKRQYKALLKNATQIIQIDKGEYSGKKLLAKDLRLIEDADIVGFAYSTPNQFTRYARELEKQVIDIMPQEEEDDYFICI